MEKTLTEKNERIEGLNRELNRKEQDFNEKIEEMTRNLTVFFLFI